MSDNRKIIKIEEHIPRQKRIKPARSFGIALILAFLLIPAIFIVAYSITEKTDDDIMHQNDVLSSSSYDNDSLDSGDLPDGDLSDGDLSDEYLSVNNTETGNADREVDEEPEPEIIGVAYLTFDDGPSLTITPGILDILADEDIKATFFTLPYSGGDEIFRRLINEGHEIGNHSHSHDYQRLYQGNVSAFRDDIVKARRFIEDNYGYSSSSFRFPGGSGDQPSRIRNPRIDVINELGYRYFDWDIDTNDWRQSSTPESIIEDILMNTRSREHVIILMHDVYERTLEALPGIIEGLREQGYAFDVLQNHPGK